MTTPEFTLRPPISSDVYPYLAFLSNPAVSIWLEDRCQRPLIASEIKAFLFGGAWCPWAIEVEGAFAGLTGFQDPIPERSQARFFIVIGEPSYWGKGLGTAVTKAAVARGFNELGLRKIVSDYLSPNLASAEIHERAGFQIEGCLREDAWREGKWADRAIVSIFGNEFGNEMV